MASDHSSMTYMYELELLKNRWIHKFDGHMFEHSNLLTMNGAKISLY